MRAAEADFSTHWYDPGAHQDPPSLLDELDRAASAEFGFTFSELAEVFGTILNLPQAAREPFSHRLDELLSMVSDEIQRDRGYVANVLHDFTLEPRERFLTGDTQADVYPWRFNRALSYLRRPLVARATPEGSEILWGSRNLYQSGRYLLDLCLSGRLKAKSDEMRKFLGRVRGEQAEQFNDLVADHFEQLDEFTTRRRVKKVGSRRITRDDGQDLGDIDVLTAHANSRSLLAVETKDFEFARTPAELSNELNDLVRGPKSAVVRHLERIHWLEGNLADVLRWLEIPNGKEGWRVKGFIVVSRDLLSPHLRSTLPMTTISYKKLSESDIKSLL